ncbi:DUF3189 family protein [Alkaliphilus pronyensis]|uniref:DUF3189 family protein n=1 Tax=Alkaliphilus pronyensis TaxID=1482732 RepID=A0A6I0FIE9_9FIRM|nr:DUF3189 family protein [Alkaliphilus pronyensis]KAB3538559.1 DUF3189 family protein [Alkaliphilus pronyensis]
MKIIYSCYGGAHTSIVAASIHLNLLPTDRVPFIKEIMSIPYYDYITNSSIGIPLYMGRDNQSNDIYVLGMGACRTQLTELIYNYALYCNIHSKKHLHVVNSIALINLPVRVGGFMSKKLKLMYIGKPITAYGIRKDYRLYAELVQNVKDTLQA